MADPKKVEELRAKFGPDVTILDACGEIVVLKRPSRAVYARFRSFLLDEGKKERANESLVADCIVWPEAAADREAIFDRYPALVDTLASEAARMAGAGVEAKKL